jgi:hypothetical protein
LYKLFEFKGPYISPSIVLATGEVQLYTEIFIFIREVFSWSLNLAHVKTLGCTTAACFRRPVKSASGESSRRDVNGVDPALRERVNPKERMRGSDMSVESSYGVAPGFDRKRS